MLDYRTLKRLAKKPMDGKAVKVAVIGDCATQHLSTAIAGTACSEGLNLRILDTDYNQMEAQLSDPASEVWQFAPDYILLVLCTEKLQEAFYEAAPEQRLSFAEDRLTLIGRYWSLAAQNRPCTVLQYNFPSLNDGVMGSYAMKEPASFPFQLQKLNYLLAEAAASASHVFPVDVNDVQSVMGRSRSFDDKVYFLSKMPFSLEALPAVAKKTVDVIQAGQGHIKKAIVLDLDNTLWGGVIGDDGLEGIQIGELGAGHAFTSFQQWLKELKKRGIVLAVCSKNEEEAAKLPFEKHPEMTLRLDDFAVFIANWEPKADNIRRIQETLNLGMDSFVFLDDNPFERDQVRRAIPEICVPELPEDPALYLPFLREQNLFETAQYSAADGERTAQYRVEAQRAQLMQSAETYGEYLRSLHMLAQASPFDAFYGPRIAQLTQRSNQFNLRTVRHTEADIQTIAADPARIGRYYLLRDQFGDYGLIGVVVLDRLNADTLFVSEWLMSCRVLKRGMEEFIVNDILRQARENGCRYVLGEYIPTKKNAMVAELYARMGFTKRDDGLFVADADSFGSLTTYITEEEQS